MPLERAWVVPQVVWAGYQGITRVKWTVIARLIEIQMWHPTASSVGGLRKGTMTSVSTSVWKKVAQPALALMSDSSVPPHMSLVPFKLLPQCWSSEQVSPSKSMNGPFKRICPGLQKPSISLSPNPHWFLQPEVMGTSLPGQGFGVGLGPLPPKVQTPQQRYLSIFIYHMWVGPVHSSSPPVLPVLMWLLLYILSCRTSIHL